MSRAKTHEEFLMDMQNLHPKIEVLSIYKNNLTHIKCKCLIDGYEWEATPNKLINAKHGCPKCGKSLPLTPDIFIEQMIEINSNIIICQDYVNSNTPIYVKCKICNHKWKARPYHLKQGRGCPKCELENKRKLYSKDMEQFVEELHQIDNTINVSGEYRNNRTKVDCECQVCGRKWKATPSNLLAGKGCPKCIASKGEKRISEWLFNQKIEFESEYRFQDCCLERPLIFDFYIPSKKIVIEYDGHQHFYPVRFGGMSEELAEQKLKSNQKRDEIKTQYCLNNGLELIRIPYWEYDNISKILEKHIS